MINLGKLIVMVGLPASGKSTKAKELGMEYNATVLSSDSIREELFGDESTQGDNNLVFSTMHQRAKELLSQGKNVIIDATNINRKRRVHLIKHELKASEYHCYYMNTSLGYCLYSDSNRSRNVGYKVIDKMYRNMQIPTVKEGWNSVTFVNDDVKYRDYVREAFEELLEDDYSSHDNFFEELSGYLQVFEDIYNLPHDSTYHSFSVSRHTYHVFKYIQENYKGDRKKELLIASLFHDVGKAHCKSFYNYKGEESVYANYIGHENVSSYNVADELKLMGYDIETIKYVVDLVQFHMSLYDWNDKKEKKLRSLLTDEQYDDLLFLHEADMKAK